MPDGCVAVAEVEVNLLTGRTHQIRGQLSSLGFPLVGDVLYGGAKKDTESSHMNITGYHDCKRLALQCCELSFVEPKISIDNDSRRKIQYKHSKNMLRWRVEKAWWTSAFEFYGQSSSEAVDTTSDGDYEKVLRLSKIADIIKSDVIVTAPETSQRLPRRVSLEPGVHKYVIVKAISNQKSSQTKDLYFVRSASAIACGGPYHADVAHNLIECLTKNGYYASVIGGGKIEFDDTVPHAHIYGFSYGFGKGNHTQVAEIIEEFTDVATTVNNVDGIY